MVLTLEVTGPEASQLGRASRKVFRASGGFIGRLPSNDWSLPDPDQIVSNRHAVIAYQQGGFSIEDRSTNGTYLNAPNNRLVKGRPQPLQNGDRIFIPPYEIVVAIAPDAGVGPSPGSSSPFDDLFGPVGEYVPSPPSHSNPLGVQGAGSPPAVLANEEEVDPLKLIAGPDHDNRPAAGRRVEELQQLSPEFDDFRPPAVVSGPALPDVPSLPDNWWNLSTDPNRPAPGPGPAPAPAVPPEPAPPVVEPPPDPPRPAFVRPTPGPRSRAASGDLAEVLAGAGLEGVPVTPELARNFGRILRVVVSGVLDLLAVREGIRDGFRVRGTSIRTQGNNPLKRSVDVDDALHNLLVKRNAAYLGPVEAFDDAFVDIRNHQLAMLEAVRVAFAAMLAEFDPERLQKEFDARNKGALLSVPAKLRYWDQYRDRIRDIVGDPDASFRELFGDEFARAYEQQLQRLRAQRRQP